MSTETLTMKNVAKSLQESAGKQEARIAPGSYATFYGQEGRNYIVALTDLDGDYPAKVSIYDMDWGNLIKTVDIQPFTGTSVVVQMGKGNGVRIYNESNQPSPGRPVVNASLYHA